MKLWDACENMRRGKIDQLTQSALEFKKGMAQLITRDLFRVKPIEIPTPKKYPVDFDEFLRLTVGGRYKDHREKIYRDYVKELVWRGHVKLIVNWRTGKRDGENTVGFLQDLKSRMASRFQLTTDAYAGYWQGGGAVRKVFGNEIDYATEMKIFNIKPQFPAPWYNPRVLLRIQRQQRSGNPDMKLATICHAERTNLSVRLFNRRFTRKTLGYSKKLENLRHSVAILVAHFNFCRVHSAHGRTPAQAANLTDHQWTITELLQSAI